MIKRILNNWKTSGAAAVLAILGILNAFWPLIFTVELCGKIAAAVTAIGFLFSKDDNVTGGTKANVPNDASEVAKTAKKDS